MKAYNTIETKGTTETETRKLVLLVIYMSLFVSMLYGFALWYLDSETTQYNRDTIVDIKVVVAGFFAGVPGTHYTRNSQPHRKSYFYYLRIWGTNCTLLFSMLI